MLMLLLASSDPAEGDLARTVLENLGFDVQFAGPGPANVELDFEAARYAVIAVGNDVPAAGGRDDHWRGAAFRPSPIKARALHAAIFRGIDPPEGLDDMIYIKPNEDLGWIDQLIATLMSLGWI